MAEVQKKSATRRAKTTAAGKKQSARTPESAVVVLKRRKGVKSGDDTHSLAKRVLHRVGQKVGEATNRFTIFRHIGSLSVEASPKFLKALAQDPAVASCRPNVVNQDLLIRPVSGRAAKIEKYQD